MDHDPDDSWPRISPQVAELIRRAAHSVAELREEWLEPLQEASLSGPTMKAVAGDPVLAEAMRRSNVAHLITWIAHNIEHPGKRVPVSVSSEALISARDLVRRGLETDAFDTYRRVQSGAWALWMDVCFLLTDDPQELHELLSVSALSISTYVGDCVEAMKERMASESAELTTGTHAERLATVTLLLEGARVDLRHAEGRLGHALTGPQTAAIVWGAPDVDPSLLEAAAETLVRAAGSTRRLTVIANAATLWVWLPTSVGPTADWSDLPDGVRVAVGRTGTGLAGFRSSHLEAVTTQQTMDRTGVRRPVATYAEVQLVSLLEHDRGSADAFVDDVLGALRDADDDLRTVARTYLQSLCNVSRTAEVLFTHRNTVIRRLQRVDDLLPRPLAENPVQVAAALELVSWRSS